jgi:hypothetical protein
MADLTDPANWAPPPRRESVPTAQALRRRFPGTLVWFGVHTQRWWALVRGRRLVEAQDLQDLEIAITRSML